MQGNKEFTPKLFYNVSLDALVSKDNFYRRLNRALDLHFLYDKTAKYYGKEGQQSIDPVVFFKICLVGYLNNIISDRKLIEYCSDSLSIRLFLGYDIDEALPWHSTISRTRQLYEEDIFEEVFQYILNKCIDAGLVQGSTQSIDSCFVKANASMDSLELKVPPSELDDYLRAVRHLSAMDKDQNPKRKAKHNKASKEQRTIKAAKGKLKSIETRQKKWSRDQDQRPGAKNKGSKYTSNKTHYSPVDPDARISVKPGKARKLNYYAQMGVDSDYQVITAIQSDYADQKDNQCLQRLTERMIKNLSMKGIEIENLLADAGYSSGENYAWLEEKGIKSFIPPHGTYKGGPEDFTYHKEGNYWECPRGKHVNFRKQRIERGTLKDFYLTRRSDCKGCPLKATCIGKQHEKKIMITAYREQYEHNNERLKKRPRHKTERMKTVEPVFGTLTNFLGMRKVNTRGIGQANKCMLMAGAVFNLKKLLKYGRKPLKSRANAKKVAQKGKASIALIMTQVIVFKSNILSHEIYFLASQI